MRPFDLTGAFYPRGESKELRRLAVRGALASISGSGLSLAAQVISTVILARLLTPADFGVVTMVTSFSLLLVSVGLNGFTEAVIQFEEMDHYTASNLFWINIGIALALAITFAASGSLLSQFYGNPLVTNVARGMSVGIVISAASVIHLALLKRSMCFGATSLNDVYGRAICAVISILLAVRGLGYWALVVGIIASQLTITLGAWFFCPWIPSLPRRTGRTGAMVRFAGKVYGQFGISYFAQNIDNLLVGWRFNAPALGFYKKAYDLFALSASQLTAPLSNVALATLSRLNQDQVRFRRYLANSLGMIAFLGMGATAYLTLVGRPVVRLVLGPKWSESGDLFEIFGPGIGAMLLCSTVGWVHISIGKAERWLRWTLLALALIVPLFLVGLHWGPRGVAAAWSVSYWILLVPSFWYAGRPIGFGVSCLIAAIWRYCASALLAGVACAAIIRGTPFSNVSSGIGASLVAIGGITLLFSALYLGAVILFHMGFAPLLQLASLIREMAPSRRAPKPAEAVGGYE